jgi:hypothetical protein
MTARGAVLGLLACCGLLACSSDKPSVTAIDIAIESDLKVPDEINFLNITISGLAGAAKHASADLTKQGFPRHLTLVHEGGPNGPILVTVAGLHDDEKIIESKVQLSFQLRTTVDVTIELQRSCKGVLSCDADQTCRDGECHSIPRIDPKPKPQDAGSQMRDMDAGAGGDSMTTPGTDAKVPIDKPDAKVPVEAGPPANLPPVCEITQPSDGQSFNTEQPIELTGTCTDPEGDVVLPSGDLRWTRGKGLGVEDLGTGSSVSFDELPEGDETFSLCADDPKDPALEGCARIEIHIRPPGPPTAEIVEVLQNGKGAPFRADKDVSFKGLGTGIEVTYAWSDSFTGKTFGDEPTATLETPEVGRHRVTFTVTDENGDSAEDTTVVDVVPAGESTLVQPFDKVNETLDEGADALAVDAESQVLAARGAELYRFDATNLNADLEDAFDGTPVPAVGAINQIFIGSDKVYLATINGLVVCDYETASPIDASSCTTFLGGSFPSNNVTAVLRAKADDVDILVLGTANGLFVPDDVEGSTTGAALTGISSAGRNIKGIVLGYALDQMLNPAQVVDVFWFTGNAGELGLYIPSDHRISERDDGKNLTQNSIAATEGGRIWVGSSNQGIGRWTEPTMVGMQTGWQNWNANSDPALPNNATFAIAATRATYGGADHDVVWIGSSAGLTRFEEGGDSETLETLTSDDGLPSDGVIAIAITPDGYKLISTDAGLALYIGP